ncbi:MAG: HNH endonuclease [Gemmatimonadetes bacterium]|nr:HNH endonuclease [Gemmatimonadota bacterium]
METATLDHVIPLSRGGNHAPGNLVAACLACKSGVRRAVRLSWKRTLKHQVWRACEGHCVYCGTGVESENFTIDHVIPASAGGGTNLLNCVASCRRCNQRKAARPLHEFILQAPEIGHWFLRYARQVARAQKRVARRAVSLGYVELVA